MAIRSCRQIAYIVWDNDQSGRHTHIILFHLSTAMCYFHLHVILVYLIAAFCFMAQCSRTTALDQVHQMLQHVTVIVVQEKKMQSTIFFIATCRYCKQKETLMDHAATSDTGQEEQVAHLCMAERPREVWYFSINAQRYSQNHAQNWIFGPPYGGIGNNICALSENF